MGGGFGIGSGVLIRGDLLDSQRQDPAPRYVLTNSHVIQEMDEVQVWMDDRTPLNTRVVGADLITDVALLELTGPIPPPLRSQCSGIPWGNSEDAQVGDFVLTLGSPFGLNRREFSSPNSLRVVPPHSPCKSETSWCDSIKKTFPLHSKCGNWCRTKHPPRSFSFKYTERENPCHSRSLCKSHRIQGCLLLLEKPDKLHPKSNRLHP